jgi:CheY-like chemotaxis protein
MDGYSLAEYVKSSPRLSQVPVLLLAGAFEPIDRGRVQQVGCDGVLIKPFEPQQLVSTVKELLALRPVVSAAVPSGGRDRSASRWGGEVEAANVTPFPAPAGTPLRLGDPVAHPAAVDRLGGHPEPLELPSRNLWESSATEAAAIPRADAPLASAASLSAKPAAPAPAAPAQKVSLVNAFSALLAAEQAAPGASGAASAGSPAVSEATIEEAVRRVLVRMTDDLVRRLVLETAERLIREEIEKIKASPDY